MCLIAWNWQPHSDLPLFLIANRDEYYARPTLPLHAWTDASIFAGKDLQAGGTWLGLAEGGRVALLVDELLGQQQVVVKNLEANYRKVTDVSGATIMGDGRSR